MVEWISTWETEVKCRELKILCQRKKTKAQTGILSRVGAWSGSYTPQRRCVALP